VDENGSQGRAEAFAELLSYLGDPHRHEVARMWEDLVASELGPAERARAERQAPIVKRYLSKTSTREEYEREIAETTIPDV
jgi:hypothetical protein